MPHFRILPGNRRPTHPVEATKPVLSDKTKAGRKRETHARKDRKKAAEAVEKASEEESLVQEKAWENMSQIQIGPLVLNALLRLKSMPTFKANTGQALDVTPLAAKDRFLAQRETAREAQGLKVGEILKDWWVGLSEPGCPEMTAWKGVKQIYARRRGKRKTEENDDEKMKWEDDGDGEDNVETEDGRWYWGLRDRECRIHRRWRS
ncbi:MAG: hypothetical protein Q9218_007020 [Villophora microphyllina]